LNFVEPTMEILFLTSSQEVQPLLILYFWQTLNKILIEDSFLCRYQN
jgi:hypothetical protein